MEAHTDASPRLRGRLKPCTVAALISGAVCVALGVAVRAVIPGAGAWDKGLAGWADAEGGTQEWMRRSSHAGDGGMREYESLPSGLADLVR